MTETFLDLAAYTALPRVTGLALHPDGNRLVATVQQPDAKGARYTTSLWQVPLDERGVPTRLTHSGKGETSPAFRADGSLLFTSARPAPDDEDEPDGAALWQLPASGEARVVARRPGGLDGPQVARGSGAVLLAGSRLARSSDADDGQRRKIRKDRKLSAILHTGMPIRHWDHELGDTEPRLLLLDAGADTPRDLAPDATFELVEAARSITADGATVAATWRTRRPRGGWAADIVLIDTATLERRVVAADPEGRFDSPVISPDGRYVAAGHDTDGTFERPISFRLDIVPVDGGARPVLDLEDLTPTEWAWSTDSATLFVAGDRHGRGAVLAVDPATGAVRTRLAADAAYSSLCPAADGRTVYALRSAWDCAPTPVALDTARSDQTPRALPTPAPTPPLPGTLVELDVPVGNVSVHAWLCLPAPAEGPAPVMQWIHGGPFGSYNAWSWRWNPWVAVARGWAVILPDPALSTGYGQECIDRAWPYLADVVWAEVEGVLDHVLERPEVDPTRVALLGASFGGFMTNWIAGHTDRFGAIVTHAGLWALDQQHATTDAAHYKTGIFGTLADHPEWYAAYSPDRSVDKIVTPMLICHGNNDYRVPVSEALRLWWDLVSRWDGDPAELPHRFLQLTGENHWVLTPGNAEVWYDVVLGFCAQHVLGETWSPSSLL